MSHVDGAGTHDTPVAPATPAAPGTFGGELRRAADLLQAAGLRADKATCSARALVLADYWGIPSHGLLRLPHYLRRLVAGGCRADAELQVTTDTGPLVSFDGQDGLGHWQLWHAAELAAERCARFGVAVAAVGRSSHCGALGLYTLPITEAGCAGLVFSNGPAVMPPWNGTRPVVSTSPIAAGFPGSDRPAVIDLATSAVARGRIAQRAAEGELLPNGWAFDAQGSPTTDPASALAGMLAPLGGAKGFALAFMVEALTGGLVGPTLSSGVADMFSAEESATPQNIAHLIVAFDPERMGVDGTAGDRLAALHRAVRSAGGRVPGARRTPPAEIEEEAPLPVAADLAGELDSWARRLGLP